MHWNYRIIKKVDKISHTPVAHTDSGNSSFELYETYYNDNGEIMAHTEEPISAFGETVDELIENLRQMLRDAEKSKEDILEYGKINFVGGL